MEQINGDLVKERDKCTFDIQELIHLIDGGKDKTSIRKNIENLTLGIKELWDDVPEEYLSHKERYENAVRKGAIVFDLYVGLTKDKPHESDRTPSNIFKVQEGIMQSVNPFVLHFGLFLPTIMNQASAEQQAEWLKKDSRMIGTYALTELGHGTFLRGIETTATFDSETDEFILHSPTLTSYKWWAGGVAHTSNHCLVMAQLIINGKRHGIHLLLVKIRDLDTHEPMPGVKVGEIGPKLGFNTADNGFLGFDHYRIPRTNLLMKNVQVLRDGTYKKSKHDKLTYGTMVFIRVQILSDVAYELSRAATIAVRYSAVRHQSQIKEGQPEPQILDFVTQQHKLFISIASCHAYRVVGQWLWSTYTKVHASIGQGNMDQLPELHALSCCLKAICSRDGTNCVEQCRLACGGHGYMLASSLPNLYSIVTANVTYEGEYTVMLLQTARYLIKAWKRTIDGQPLTPTVIYLAEHQNIKYSLWINSPEGIVEGFKAVAAGKIRVAWGSIQSNLKKGKDYEDAWNMASIKLTAASDAHARAILCDAYWSQTKEIMKTVSDSLAIVLQQLAELYLVYWSLEKCGDLLMYSTITEEDIAQLQQRYEELLSLIRPNAVGLVDAFDIIDEILNSTLGAYDGRVYERMMEQALKSPLNAEPVNRSFEKYIRPLMIKHKL